MYIRPKKSLGQNFLVSESIARAEAAHAESMNVLEVGPGYGILTKELLKRARMVVAVEKDADLCAILSSEISSRKLRLINKDFLDASPEELGLPSIDIMISNIPYNLSSKTIGFLIRSRLQAVLCLQREFVDHMLAMEGTRDYTKLSVVSRLSFSMTRIMEVKRGNFRPVPKVDSAIIYLKPKAGAPSEDESRLIGLIMQHKKKGVRRAIMDSSSYLGVEKEVLSRVCVEIGAGDEKVFKLPPVMVLEIAKRLGSALE